LFGFVCEMRMRLSLHSFGSYIYLSQTKSLTSTAPSSLNSPCDISPVLVFDSGISISIVTKVKRFVFAVIATHLPHIYFVVKSPRILDPCYEIASGSFRRSCLLAYLTGLGFRHLIGLGCERLKREAERNEIGGMQHMTLVTFLCVSMERGRRKGNRKGCRDGNSP